MFPGQEVILRGGRRRVAPGRPLISTKNNRDLSVTQFAVIDDENVSATQQVTKGGGGKNHFSFNIFINLAILAYCLVLISIYFHNAMC